MALTVVHIYQMTQACRSCKAPKKKKKKTPQDWQEVIHSIKRKKKNPKPQPSKEKTKLRNLTQNTTTKKDYFRQDLERLRKEPQLKGQIHNSKTFSNRETHSGRFLVVSLGTYICVCSCGPVCNFHKRASALALSRCCRTAARLRLSSQCHDF